MSNERWDRGLVEVGQECPKCGEDDMDSLVWNEDLDTVTCAKCGTVYTPPICGGVQGAVSQLSTTYEQYMAEMVKDDCGNLVPRSALLQSERKV
jgi:uncharacterized Zn finger protein